MRNGLKTRKHWLVCALCGCWLLLGLSVRAAPTILQSPTNQAVFAGSNAVFQVTASNGPAAGLIRFQWRKESTNLTFATNATLLLGNVQPTDGGRYSVVITDQTGSVTSAPANLFVIVPLGISQQPQPITAPPGGSATFSVVATGAPPPRYQWLWNGTVINGATNQSLTLDNLTPAQEGNYSAHAWNNFTAVDSLAATLNVFQPPQFISHPVSLTVEPGQPAAFSARLLNDPSLRLQWLHNGNDLAGETNASLFLPTTTAADAGEYRLRASNTDGTNLSQTAFLSVLDPVSILQQPQTITTAPGSNVLFTVQAAGSAPLSFQWFYQNQPIPDATNNVLVLANVSTTAAGFYQVRIWNAFSAAESDPAELRIGFPPVITQPPLSQTVAINSPLALSVGVEGTGPLSFQWALNGVILPLQTNRSLATASAQPENSGFYRVMVSNWFGAVTSAPALVQVLAPVEINPQPQSLTVLPGDPAFFHVGISGSPPIRFQWFHQGQKIDGATNQNLLLSNAQPALGGLYHVEAWNALGTNASAAAELVVLQPPLITQHPSNQTVWLGSSASFAVLAQGAAPLTYQWFNGLNPIPDATNRTLLLPIVHAADESDYRVLVRNEDGSTLSEPAHLSVIPPPLTLVDHFSNAVPVSGLFFFNVQGTNLGATREPTEPLHDGQRGHHSVWLAWTAPSNGVASVNTLGSDFDTVLAVYAGPSLDALVPIQSDDDVAPENGTIAPGQTTIAGQTSDLRFNAVAGVTYHLAVDGVLDAAGFVRLQLSLDPAREFIPTFLAHPRRRSVRPGEDFTFDFAFSSESPAQIQWIFEEANLANATVTSNLIRGVDEAQVGRYRVRITTPTSTNFSRWGELQINSRGFSNVLAHDKLSGAVDFGQFDLEATSLGAPKARRSPGAGAKSGGSGTRGYTTTQIFSTLGSGKDLGEPNHCGLAAGKSEWFTYQAETNGLLRIDTEGSSFNTLLAVYIGPGDSYSTLTNVACDLDSGSNGITSKVLFQATKGTIYYIAVDGTTNVAPNSGTVRLNLHLGTPVSIATPPQSQSLPTGTNAVLFVEADGMTNYLYQWRFQGTNIPGAISSNLNLSALNPSQAGAYDVIVHNPLNAVTSLVAVLSLYSGTLLITNPPASLIALTGSNASFQVGASGLGAIGYQWRCNGTNIPGATASSLFLTNLHFAHQGVYDVNLTDANGSLLSAPATLTVWSPPVITIAPSSQTISPGASLILTAAASGQPVPMLQWHFNGAPIPGATTSNLSLTNFQAGQEGHYHFSASNAVGSVWSSPAELYLNSPVRLTNALWSNGVFRAQLIGVSNATYLVSSSSNLIHWVPVATNTSATGISDFIETATNAGPRAYRAQTSP